MMAATLLASPAALAQTGPSQAAIDQAVLQEEQARIVAHATIIELQMEVASFQAQIASLQARLKAIQKAAEPKPLEAPHTESPNP